jgi:hypothetical protein
MRIENKVIRRIRYFLNAQEFQLLHCHNSVYSCIRKSIRSLRFKQLLLHCYLYMKPLYPIDTHLYYYSACYVCYDRLSGLVVRVPGCRSSDPGFDIQRCWIVWVVVGLERCPLGLVSITEELLEWEISGSGFRKSRLTAVEIRCAEHAAISIRKS